MIPLHAKRFQNSIVVKIVVKNSFGRKQNP